MWVRKEPVIEPSFCSCDWLNRLSAAVIGWTVFLQLWLVEQSFCSCDWLNSLSAAVIGWTVFLQLWLVEQSLLLQLPLHSKLVVHVSLGGSSTSGPLRHVGWPCAHCLFFVNLKTFVKETRVKECYVKKCFLADVNKLSNYASFVHLKKKTGSRRKTDQEKKGNKKRKKEKKEKKKKKRRRRKAKRRTRR